MIAAATRADQRADDDGKARARHKITDRHGRAIGAEAEIGGVAERQHAGVAEQEIERHGGEAEHHDAAAELGVAADRRHPKGQVSSSSQTTSVGACLRRREPTRTSLFAEKAARPHQQHRRHHHVDHRLGGRREEHRGEAGGDADQQAAEQGAGQAAEPADDDGHKARHDQRGADGRLQAELARRQHAGKPGEIDAEAEIQVAQQPTLTPSTDTVSRSSVPARMRMPSRVWLRIEEQRRAPPRRR